MTLSLLRNLCFVCCCILLKSICGIDGFEVEPRIIGGGPHEKRYPFVVSIIEDSIYHRQHICGGSIINRQTILTSAYCLLRQTPTSLKIHVGDTSLEVKDGKVYDVEDIYSHEKFNETSLDYDVGLIRIKGSLKFSATVLPIKLATRKDKIKDGSYALVMGWGITDNYNQMLSDELMVANVPIVNQAICNHQMDGSITKRMICAGYNNGGVDSCRYDAGGPLVANEKQIGIVSKWNWGYECALPNRPGVYSRISVILPWIENILLKKYYERLF